MIIFSIKLTIPQIKILYVEAHEIKATKAEGYHDWKFQIWPIYHLIYQI